MKNDLYTPYEYKGKTILIERYLLLGELECAKEDYNLFDLTVDPFAQEKIAQIDRTGHAGFEVFAYRDRELFNTFKYYLSRENKKIFLYSEVYSKTKTKIIICAVCSKYGKLWVNGKCVSIHHQDWGATYYHTIQLNKGINSFLLEQYSPDEKSVLSLQILNYRYEMSDAFKSISNLSRLCLVNPMLLICDQAYIPEKNTFKWMYLLNDDRYLPEYRIDIHDSSTGFVKTMNARINEPVEIDVSELRGLHEESLRHEWIGCTFKDPKGNEFATGLCIFTKDFHRKTDEIVAELNDCITEQSQESKTQVEGLIARNMNAKKRNDNNLCYWSSWNMREVLNWAKAGTCAHEVHKMPGMHEFYIHSDLDDSIVRILNLIPDSYDGKEAYPIVLALSTGNEGGFAWCATVEKNLEGFLIFDVTGRGFTGGSYIGEASTLEILNWIFANYNVNRDRVYVLGGSNGGFATWALAQNHPHFVAAIYPLIGYPNIENVENASNIPAYQLVSPKDHVFIGRTNKVKERLKAFGNYIQYDFQEMLHTHFSNYLPHPAVIKELTKHKRNLYPDQMIYRTVRNRHLESYWVKLHGIVRGKTHAKITARIENQSQLSIRIQNTDGVTITLPPEIDRKTFAISVNGQAVAFTNYTKPKIILKKNKGKWIVSDSEPPVDYRKGTGLLDVYMNSLRLIVPENPSGALKNVAQSCSKPFTNGYDPVVFVDYPIYEADGVPDHIFGHNLILLESPGCPNSYVRRFADKLPVQYDDTGYTYKGVRTDGNYVVMQVIPNPYDPRRTFLVIFTNDEALFKKHILLRKVIIPTYVNGLHPLWNNEILIFDGKEYLAAYEAGDELKQV